MTSVGLRPSLPASLLTTQRSSRSPSAKKELFYIRRTPRLPSTFPTGDPKGTKAKVTSRCSLQSPILGAPASAVKNPGEASRTSLTHHRPRDIPEPPRGQTRRQAQSSPAAPCGGASGDGGTHPSCGTPGGISSRRARRTPSPHPRPPPACAAWGQQDGLRPCLAAPRGDPGLGSCGTSPLSGLPSTIPHPLHTSTLQVGTAGKATWRRGALSRFCNDRSPGRKIRGRRGSLGCGDLRSRRGQIG